MGTQKTELILATSGGELVKATLQSIGQKGDEAFKKIKGQSLEASAGLKVLNATVGEVKGKVGELQDGAGATGRILGALGPGGTAAAAGIGAIVLAGGAAAATFLSLTRNAVDWAGALDDARAKTGFHVEKLQELQFQARQYGVDNETLVAGLAKFTKNVGDARSGTGTLVVALKDNDRALLDQIRTHADINKAYDLYIDKIASAKTEQDAATLAVAGFSRGGLALLPVLRDGTAGAAAMATEARKLGVIVKEDLIAKGDKAGDSLQVLADTIRGNLYTAVLEVGPEIAGMAQSLAELISQARQLPLVGRFLNHFSERGRATNEADSLDAQAGRASRQYEASSLQQLITGKRYVDPRTGQMTDVDPGQALRERADEFRRQAYEIDQQDKAISDEIARKRQERAKLTADPTGNIKPTKGGGAGAKSAESAARDEAQLIIGLQDKIDGAASDGLAKIMAERDKAYLHEADLNERSHSGQETLARANLLIWQDYEKQKDALHQQGLDKLAELETEAANSSTGELASIGRIQTARDKAYADWARLAHDKGNTEEELARGNVAIWQIYDDKLTDEFAKSTKEWAKPFEDFGQEVGQGIESLFSRIAEGGRITADDLVKTLQGAAIKLLVGLGETTFKEGIAPALLSLVSGGGGGGGGGTASGAVTQVARLFGISPSAVATAGFSADTLSALASGTTTAGLLTFGLGALQQNNFKLTPFSGGMLGLSALRSVAPYLANTSYGASVLGQLGNGQASQLLQGLLGITGNAGAAQGPLLQAGPWAGGYVSQSAADAANAGIAGSSGQAAGSLASTVSSAIAVIGALYSLYSSVAGAVELNRGFKKATFGDSRATSNFAALSYGSLGVATGIGAVSGLAIGAAGSGGNPFAAIIGALVGAAAGAATSYAASSIVGGAVSKETQRTIRQGLTQAQLDKAVGENTLLQIGSVYTSSLKGSIADIFIKSITPDIEDIFDKMLVGRVNRGAGLEFSRRPTVLFQGLTKGQKENALGTLDEVKDWAGFLNQVSGEGTGIGGERDRRTTALLFNNIAARAKTPEQAEELLRRAIAGFLGNNLPNALAFTNRQFFNPQTGNVADGKQAEYVDRLGKVLDVLSARLPQGTDGQQLAQAVVDQFGRATTDRVRRTARNLRAADVLSGAISSDFDGFTFSEFGRGPGELTRKQRRGVAKSENAVYDTIDAITRAQLASQYGVGAGVRLGDEEVKATFDKIGALRPNQFAKQLPDLVNQLVDATQKLADQWTGMIDTMRSLEQAAADARLSLGTTIDDLLHTGDTASLYQAEIARQNAGLALAKSGGARVGYYTSLINLESGYLQHQIADLQTSANNRGIFGLAQLNPTVTNLRQQLTEAGLSPRKVAAARKALVEQAVAQFGSATGDDKVAAAQRALNYLPSYLEAAGNTRAARAYGLGVLNRVGGVTAAAEAEAQRIDRTIKQYQYESAQRLQTLSPKLFAAYADQLKEGRDTLKASGLSDAQINAAVADPEIEAQIVRQQQLKKITEFAADIRYIRDHGLKIQKDGTTDGAGTGGGRQDQVTVPGGAGYDRNNPPPSMSEVRRNGAKGRVLVRAHA